MIGFIETIVGISSFFVSRHVNFIIIIFTYVIEFNIMGRDYDAAILVSGTCGFGTGATPNAKMCIRDRNRGACTLSDLQMIDLLEHRISAHENAIHALLTDIVLHFIDIVA